MIEIDGSIMEGGGQILRNSVALATLLKVPIKIYNIRGNRSKPGLRPQHLTGLQLISEISNGKLSGAEIGSTTITFSPNNVAGGEFVGDTKTAGSICLLLQASLPCLLFAKEPSRLILKGGTNAEMAPPIDYFQEVFHHYAAHFGVQFDINLKRRGFYPKGGGEVAIDVSPVDELKPINMTDCGKVLRIRGFAFTAGTLPLKVARTMAQEAKTLIQRRLNNVPVQIDSFQENQQRAVGNGCGILIIADTSTGCHISGSALGKRGVPAEKVGVSAAEMLLTNLGHNACVDEYMQDQIILYMALAGGRSVVRTGPITLHTETAIHIATTLTKANFVTREIDASAGTHEIECDGIGYKAQRKLLGRWTTIF